MKDDIARMRCPVCGTPTGARVNKNGIIYLYCPNSHHVRLSREDSRAAMAAIRSGMKWHNELIYIYPKERKQENGTTGNPTITTGTDNSTGSTGSTGNQFDGRPTGQIAAVREISGNDDYGFGLI